MIWGGYAKDKYAICTYDTGPKFAYGSKFICVSATENGDKGTLFYCFFQLSQLRTRVHVHKSDVRVITMGCQGQ